MPAIAICNVSCSETGRSSSTNTQLLGAPPSSKTKKGPKKQRKTAPAGYGGHRPGSSGGPPRLLGLRLGRGLRGGLLRLRLGGGLGDLGVTVCETAASEERPARAAEKFGWFREGEDMRYGLILCFEGGNLPCTFWSVHQQKLQTQAKAGRLHNYKSSLPGRPLWAPPLRPPRLPYHHRSPAARLPPLEI